MDELIPRDGNQIVGQVMKMVHSRNSNAVEVVEVLNVQHGLIRLRFLERSRRPVIWMPLGGILELRETEGRP